MYLLLLRRVDEKSLVMYWCRLLVELVLQNLERLLGRLLKYFRSNKCGLDYRHGYIETTQVKGETFIINKITRSCDTSITTTITIIILLNITTTTTMYHCSTT